VFVLPLNPFFFNWHLVWHKHHPKADKACPVWRQMLKTKSGFPVLAIKATLSAINIFTPTDREEKNAPLTDTACQAGRADLLKKRPLSLVDPTLLPTASLLFAFSLLYMSQYFLRRGEPRRAACVYCRGAAGRLHPMLLVCVCACVCVCVGLGRLCGWGAEKTEPSPARLLEC